jgi:CubicO group peptidase (beta-lactamase class C family)
MKTQMGSITVALLLGGVASNRGAETSASLPRATPEAEGVSSAAVLEFVEAADRQIDAMNSFMLVRHGAVVAEGWWAPYDAASNHELYSLSKSFTSTAVGLAIAEGKLSLDDTVLKFFPEDAPAEPSANLRAMRVRDLLCMSAGHQDETSAAADKVSAKAFLAHPVPHKPGTHFKYNTAATFMLSAIVQKQTGQTVLDYLRPRLFEPLGIDHPVWDTNWQGISLGGYGLRVRTEDIARLGQLYLQQGRWQGKQLIPAAWVEAATARQTSTGSNPNSDWDQGYGYQFWRCRHGAYRGDGAFGQYCLVLPEQDAVVAITSGVKDMQAVLNLVWDKLLPAFHGQVLPVDADAQAKLTQKLAGLVLRTPDGKETSPLTGRVFGHRYVFSPNERKLESILLEPAAGGRGLALVMRSHGVESRFPGGFGEWEKGRGDFGSYSNEPVAASAAWVKDDTCVFKLCAFETPFYQTITLRFDGDQLFYDAETNTGFGATKQAQLVGNRIKTGQDQP